MRVDRKPGMFSSWPQALLVAVVGLIAWAILIALIVFAVRLIR